MCSLVPALVLGIMALTSTGSLKAAPASTISELEQQLADLTKADKTSEAISVARQLLGLQEKQFGSVHLALLPTLDELGRLERTNGDWSEAATEFQRAWQLSEQLLGTNDVMTLRRALRLAELYARAKSDAKAKPLLRRALPALEQESASRGTSDPPLARALSSGWYDLALLEHRQRHFSECGTALERALRVVKQSLGTNDPQVFSMERSLQDQLKQNKGEGRSQAALPLAATLVQLHEWTLGDDAAELVSDLTNLAVAQHGVTDYPAAAQSWRRVLEIYTKLRGPDAPQVEVLWENIAKTYEAYGALTEAEQARLTAIRLYERHEGPDHRYTQEAILRLGRVYLRLHQLEDADRYLNRSLEIAGRTQDTNSPGFIVVLEKTAAAYQDAGLFERAEPLRQQALGIRERNLGPDDPKTGQSAGMLGILYIDMSEFARGVRLLQRNVDIQLKAHTENHLDTAQAIDELAAGYRIMGDNLAAEQQQRRAVRLFEALVGSDDPRYARALESLADCLRHTHPVAGAVEAETMIRRSIAIRENVSGPNHQALGPALTLLASALNRQDRFDEAAHTYERALAISTRSQGTNGGTAHILFEMGISQADSGDTARAIGTLEQTRQILQKIASPEDDRTQRCLQQMARLYLRAGQSSNALAAARQAREIESKRMTNVLSLGGDTQRLRAMATFDPYTAFATLGESNDLAAAVLRHKSVVLDSFLVEARQDPEHRSLVDQLERAKARAAMLQWASPSRGESKADYQRQREEAVANVDRLHSELSRRSGSAALLQAAAGLSVEDVQAALPANAVLLEWVLYENLPPKPAHESDRLGVLVIGHSGPPRWVSGPVAFTIRTNVLECLELLSSIRNNDRECEQRLRDLYNQLWAPIQSSLPPGTRTVFVSPTHVLNFFPFSVLLAPAGRFLGEELTVRYVATGRDLVRQGEPSAARSVVAFYNPDYQARSANPGNGAPTPALPGATPAQVAPLHLLPLPGTSNEARLLKSVLGTNWHWQEFQGPQASEAELKQIHSPAILHLATHGFQKPRATPAADSSPILLAGQRGIGGSLSSELVENARTVTGPMTNPMHRNCLALAGAQITLDAWSRGAVPPVENDGILTAEEASSLDLRGTWLVTLAACDTALGEARASEGVLGLRRGFVQAGAQNVLLTLWQVADEESARFMADFYAAVAEARSPADALAQVQREWLTRVRREQGLHAAVRTAGPFLISSQSVRERAERAQAPR
ncbi:MAG TPA: CHAT domain-containing tetratricopeptide repeat protein [Verrucomicrobiae bacterium]|nr:CHAT domain-containing tetratricopeptide repeat protein [Verrucomicrobiae bacterium]